MNSRERVRRALSHQEPDRVPIDFGSHVVSSIHKDVYGSLRTYLGLRRTEPAPIMHVLEQVVIPHEDLLRRFEVDFRPLLLGSPSGWHDEDLSSPSCSAFRDEWGIIYKRPISSLYYDWGVHPLADATIEDVRKYKFPDPWDRGIVDGLREKALYWQDAGYATVVSFARGPFQQCWNLRGMENFFIDLKANLPLAELLLRRYTDYSVELADHVLSEIGDCLDVILVGDDLAGKHGPLVSPTLYRELVKPCHKAIYSVIRERTEAKILYHTDGAAWEFIPDLIDIGVDGLNPIDVTARDMSDTKKLKNEFGDRLFFWGGFDTQTLLSSGTPSQIEEEVKRRIGDLAPGGGFVFAPCHNIQADARPENIGAFFRAGLELGGYADG